MARELLTVHAANEAADETGDRTGEAEATGRPDSPDSTPDQNLLDPGDDHASPVEENEV